MDNMAIVPYEHNCTGGVAPIYRILDDCVEIGKIISTPRLT